MSGPLAAFVMWSSGLTGGIYANPQTDTVKLCFNKRPVYVARYLVPRAIAYGATRPPCR